MPDPESADQPVEPSAEEAAEGVDAEAGDAGDGDPTPAPEVDETEPGPTTAAADDDDEASPAEEAAGEKYAFLSDEWVEAARRIREEFKGQVPAGEHAVKLNQVITDVPFGEGTVDAHLDTSGGQLELDLGHLDDAEVSITLDYETAKAVFIDPQSAIQHFMAGKIKIQGDMTKLLTVVQAPPESVAGDAQRRIAAITA